MDVKKVIEGYINSTDWRVKENANTAYSFSGLSLRLSEDAIEEYMLNNIFTPEIKDAHTKCYIKLHDAGFNSIYCVGHDMRKILNEGLNGVKGKISTVPPKHLNSAMNILVNYLGISQMEAAGAQAFNNFSTFLAPYVKVDNLSYEVVKQNIQNFVYHSNTNNRWGSQSVFSNVTLDFSCPEMFKKDKPLIGGKEVDFTYGDCDKEIDMVNRALFEVMMAGDSAGAPFTFPIITVNVTKDFNWESESAKLMFKATAKYGTPYFQNFINSNLSPDDTYSMCCRIQLDKRELKKHTGGLFGNGSATGSYQVITLNLPKYAYEAKGNIGKYYELIKKYALIAKEAHEIKRKMINENMERGLFPYLKRYLGNFNNFFCTIGIVGGNEACINLIKKDITTPEGKQLMLDTLKYIRELIADFQEDTGHLYNLEATPAESTAHKLAKYDKQQYPDIFTSGVSGAEYYTNSTALPVNVDYDIPTILEHQEELQTLYNSGTVIHFYLNEEIKDWKTAMKLVKRIASNSKIPFFSLNPLYSVCPICKYVSGVHKYCPNEHSKEELESHGIEIQ